MGLVSFSWVTREAAIFLFLFLGSLGIEGRRLARHKWADSWLKGVNINNEAIDASAEFRTLLGLIFFSFVVFLFCVERKSAMIFVLCVASALLFQQFLVKDIKSEAQKIPNYFDPNLDSTNETSPILWLSILLACALYGYAEEQFGELTLLRSFAIVLIWGSLVVSIMHCATTYKDYIV